MEEETMFLKSIAISWPGQPLICIAVTETMEDRISLFFSSLSHEYFIRKRDIGNGTPSESLVTITVITNQEK